MFQLSKITFLTFIISIIFSNIALSKNIISSIKPLDSLVKMIADEDDKTILLISNNKSPHGFNLKPSNIKNIVESDIIFYVDDNFESFLPKILEKHKNIVKVPLLQESDLRLLNSRQTDNWKSKSTNVSDKNVDQHIWLDTKNAKEMLDTIRKELSKINPEKSEIYRARYSLAIKRINKLYEEIRDELKDIKDNKFMVYHDATHYFENQFELSNVGTITKNPHFNVSFKSLKQNIIKARNNEIKCVFYEPQFNKKFANIVANGSKTKVVRIDPIGFNLEPSKTLYLDLMRGISKSIVECSTNIK